MVVQGFLVELVMVVYGFSVESIGNCCLIAMGRSNGKCQLNYCHWVVPIGDRCSFAFWIASGLNSEGFPSNPEFCFNIVGISQQWLLHPGYFVDTTIACLHVLQWLLLRRRLLIFNIIYININVETLIKDVAYSNNENNGQNSFYKIFFVILHVNAPYPSASEC